MKIDRQMTNYARGMTNGKWLGWCRLLLQLMWCPVAGDWTVQDDGKLMCLISSKVIDGAAGGHTVSYKVIRECACYFTFFCWCFLGRPFMFTLAAWHLYFGILPRSFFLPPHNKPTTAIATVFYICLHYSNIAKVVHKLQQYHNSTPLVWKLRHFTHHYGLVSRKSLFFLLIFQLLQNLCTTCKQTKYLITEKKFFLQLGPNKNYKTDYLQQFAQFLCLVTKTAYLSTPFLH